MLVLEPRYATTLPLPYARTNASHAMRKKAPPPTPTPLPAPAALNHLCIPLDLSNHPRAQRTVVACLPEEGEKKKRREDENSSTGIPAPSSPQLNVPR